jgi:TPR repeat protein
MCANGEGGPKDLPAAYQYFALAADAGVPRAAIRFAQLTLDAPPGVVTDRARARHYVSIVVRGPQKDPTVAPTRDDMTEGNALLPRLR